MTDQPTIVLEDGASITPTDNGPYQVRGKFKIILPSGADVTPDRSTVFLCRCGGSTRKPFCDGTHSRVGFQAAEAAVEQAEQTNPGT